MDETIVYVLPCEVVVFARHLSCRGKVGKYSILFDVNFLWYSACSKNLFPWFFDWVCALSLDLVNCSKISLNCCMNAAKNWSKVWQYFEENKVQTLSKLALYCSKKPHVNSTLYFRLIHGVLQGIIHSGNLTPQDSFVQLACSVHTVGYKLVRLVESQKIIMQPNIK